MESMIGLQNAVSTRKFGQLRTQVTAGQAESRYHGGTKSCGRMSQHIQESVTQVLRFIYK